jgi:diacylglycerol kinase (ATP)
MEQSLIQSFKNASSGIRIGLRKQRNLKIQIAMAVIAFVLSILLRISKLEIMIVIMISFLVLILELLNTALEQSIDYLHPYYDKKIGIIKDMLAGVVLLSAVLSIIIGVLIFCKPIINLL